MNVKASQSREWALQVSKRFEGTAKQQRQFRKGMLFLARMIDMLPDESTRGLIVALDRNATEACLRFALAVAGAQRACQIARLGLADVNEWIPPDDHDYRRYLACTAELTEALMKCDEGEAIDVAVIRRIDVAKNAFSQAAARLIERNVSHRLAVIRRTQTTHAAKRHFSS